eukprot:3450657-Pyramimonas_sp.AAC.1
MFRGGRTLASQLSSGAAASTCHTPSRGASSPAPSDTAPRVAAGGVQVPPRQSRESHPVCCCR